MSETTTSIPQASEPPPIIKSDVNQYANVLAKKSYLNESRSLIKENIPTPQAPTQQPRAAASNDVTSLLQNVQKKYNSSTPQEKAIITKILSSLS